jgi:hypothetical protein
MRILVGALALAGCGAGEGTWAVETWGEDYIEQQIPAEVFADGCTVAYEELAVVMTGRRLVDGNGDTAGELAAVEVYDLTVPGPVSMGAVPVPADHYTSVVVTIAPSDEAVAATASADQVAELAAAGASVLADGTLTCGSASGHFRWTFTESTTYGCEPLDLTIPAGGEDTTQITIHGDHLFYDGLENPDAAVRGQAILDADADADGEITLAELDAVSIPALGYEVGQYSDVVTLREFVSHLTRTLAHVDGEGECAVDL